MTSAEWALLVAIGAHAAAMVAAIVKLVAWAASTHARIEARLNAIEGKVDNDIAGRRIVAEMKSDVAVIKATMSDLKEHVRVQVARLDEADRQRCRAERDEP